jgi:hypothetical protein
MKHKKSAEPAKKRGPERRCAQAASSRDMPSPKEIVDALAQANAEKRAAVAVGIMFHRRLQDGEREAIAGKVKEVLESARAEGELLPRGVAPSDLERIQVQKMSMDESIRKFFVA